MVDHSRGALVATALAERRPDLVTALVILCPPWSLASRATARGPIERALTQPGLGDLLWALASGERQRAAQRSAFAPGTPVPDQFVADLRTRGRRNFAAGTRAIDTYLAVRALPDRLARLTRPIALAFGELDARVRSPTVEFATLPNATTTTLRGVGHTPAREAPQAVADLITQAMPATSP